MPFVTTPRRIGGGQRIEIARTIRAAWKEVSTDTRSIPLDSRREADMHVIEEVRATDGDAISEMSATFTAWREKVAYNTEELESLALAGKTYVLEAVNGGAAVRGNATPEERMPLQIEYATLCDPMPIDRVPRAIANGTSVADIGALVLALMLRHLRGAGVYVPSMVVDATATLVSSTNDVGTFDVEIAPADPDGDQLRMTGQLALGADGWPRTLTLAGTCVRRIASRFQTTTQDGTLSVAVAWTY